MTNGLPPEKRPTNIDDIFNDAIELSPSERASFLDKVCADDPSLRRDIEEMLEIADKDPDLLEPPSEFQTPDVLGKYRIISQTGRGGMGMVYKALDTQLNRTVALKVLPHDLARHRTSLERFEREARVLASLSDERIATLHSLEQDKGIHFLTMEFVEGRTLATILSQGPIDLATTLDISSQMARALEVAHANGIIHRDFKPANIMLTPQGHVKILDFGIAKTLSADAPERSTDLSSVGRGSTALLGTPAYMSPEQIRGEPIDHRCDIWALGCILFECLTGERLLSADPSFPDGLAPPNQLFDPSRLPRRTPASVARLVSKCLEPDPERRINSSAEARRILDLAARRFGQNKRIRLAALFLIPVFIGVVLVAILGRSPPELLRIENLDTQTIRAVGVDGHTLWTHKFLDEVVDPHGTPVPLTLVERNHRSMGILAQTYSNTRPSALWYLDATDGSIIWKRDASWVEPVNPMGVFFYDWINLVRWPRINQPVIAAGLRDGVWYLFTIQFVTLDGDVLGTYYHPGPLSLPERHELAQRDDGVLLLTGLNSSARFVRRIVPFETRQHCGCLILLRPPAVNGQAFPYSQEIPSGRDWPGMPRAREEAYLLIPPIHPAFNSYVTRLFGSGEDRNIRKALQAVTSDGRMLLLERNLRPISCYITVGSRADSLQAIGEANFLPLLYIREGIEELVEVPVEL